MPNSVIGWGMFTFFAIGAAGGWVVLGLWINDILRGNK